MKSYTDINQSKVLAEILPIESADMYYFLDPTPAGNIYHLTAKEIGIGIKNIPEYDEGDIPCWSLAALLDVINQVREIFHQRVTFLVGRYAGGHWYVELLRVQDERSVCIEHSKELVDACVEMIVKLKEQKLL